ncbi:hypothetical protein ED312_00905 [Sinomicrobium pectinilyticum]|uniref:Uncharacterized protein n=1 Tax=Sinomicrobium pectinilyticum TaxID=1084421 RepID=A0A3N0F548_SINP1|nr:DUF6730 family protein [Sinomicrobium pectinilyticum]RNL95191.1 hypothetical protein ED312_00905 [Sinomicrobium pectinilyticum]
MAKLEEIAELLTEEIYGFNKSIDRLEELSEYLGDIKVRADATNIEQLLQKHFHKQEENLSGQSSKLDKVYETMEDTYLLPRWIVILFFVCVGVTFLSVGAAIFYYQKNDNTKETMTQYIRHYNSFFKDTPEAKKLYQEWTDKEKNRAK